VSVFGLQYRSACHHHHQSHPFQRLSLLALFSFEKGRPDGERVGLGGGASEMTEAGKRGKVTRRAKARMMGNWGYKGVVDDETRTIFSVVQRGFIK